MQQPAHTKRADRHFGIVTRLFDDGAAMIRWLDGRGEVMPDAIGARRVDRELRVGMRIEFEVKFDREAGEDRARYACTVEDGARRLETSLRTSR